MKYTDHWANYVNSVQMIEDETFANDFLTSHFRKKTQEVTFLKSEKKRKIRKILEHCRSAAAGGVVLWPEVVVVVDIE